MSAVKNSVLPPDFFESLNEDQAVVEVPAVENEPQARPTVDLSSDPDYPDLQDDWGDDEPGLEIYAERFESASEGIPYDEMDSLAEGIVDLLHASKEGLSFFYDTRFDSILKKKFTEDQKAHIVLVESLYFEDKLDVESISILLEKSRDKSPSFAAIDLVDLLSVANEYKRLRKRYRSKEINEKVEEGIRRNLKLTMQKYMAGSEPDPLFLLGFYIVAAFAGDAVNIAQIIMEDKKK